MQEDISLAMSPQVVALLIGQAVPEFTLPSSSGDIVSSASLLGTRYVLYFYPKDQTPGCTTEAHEFSVVTEKFEKTGVKLFGVSPDSIESHLKFIKNESITFPLLSDDGHEVAEKFGVWVEKSMYGKKYMGINRSTFVIDADGEIETVYRDVRPEGHAVCVLGGLK